MNVVTKTVLKEEINRLKDTIKGSYENMVLLAVETKSCSRFCADSMINCNNLLIDRLIQYVKNFEND